MSNRYTKHIPKCSGVYSITNTFNNKRYIGFSSNMKRRMQEHIPALNNNSHINCKLQSDWNLYKNYFILEVIEITEDYLQEEYWINFHSSINKGYNVDLGRRRSESTRHKISCAGKGVSKCKGRVRPVKERERISNTLMSHEVSEVTRKKISLTTEKNHILRKLSKCTEDDEISRLNLRLSEIDIEYTKIKTSLQRI